MRNKDQILFELTAIQEFLLKGIPDSDIQSMLSTLSRLTVFLASSGALSAEAEYLYLRAKEGAYQAVKESMVNKSPSLINEFLNTKCADEAYILKLADRINASCTHHLDAVRTAISAEKSLTIASNYSTTR